MEMLPFELAKHRDMDNIVECVGVRLAAPDRLIEQAAAVLSPEEYEKARRFRFPQLRRKYILSHACLRILLGEYLQLDPRSVGICVNALGKPSIWGEDLEFNMSHSGEIAIYAFTRGAAIGVDVEQLRAMPDLIRVAEQFFAPEEIAGLAAMAAEGRNEAFFRCWTRKEALIKSTGLGLSQPLDRFQVSLQPGSPALLSFEGCTESALAWTFYDLDPARGYIGSIALRAPRRDLHVFPLVNSSQFFGSVAPGVWMFS